MKRSISLAEFIKLKRDESKARQKKHKEKINSLTTEEMIRFKSLAKQEETFSLGFMLFPFYTAFYLGLFSLVMRLAFSINLTKPVMQIISILLGIWIPVLIAIILEVKPYNRKLVDRIIQERHGR